MRTFAIIIFSLSGVAALEPASFAKVVHSRYACKAFTDRPIADDVLVAVLTLTQRCPTSFNVQPWKAVVVRSTEAKAALAAAMPDGNRPKVESAPLSVVFAADLEPEKLLSDETPDFIKQALPFFVGQCSTPEAWAFKQCAFAADHFMLAASAYGVQTCPMEGFESIQAVRDAVGLSDRFSVPIVVSCGYEREPRAKVSPRRDFSALFCLDDAATPFPAN